MTNAHQQQPTYPVHSPPGFRGNANATAYPPQQSPPGFRGDTYGTAYPPQQPAYGNVPLQGAAPIPQEPQSPPAAYPANQPGGIGTSISRLFTLL